MFKSSITSDYLFKGARPVITSAPAHIGYNDPQNDETFGILTPNAPTTTLPDVQSVVLESFQFSMRSL
jgi:hypothetical protein